jgi:hypothetical protein
MTNELIKQLALAGLWSIPGLLVCSRILRYVLAKGGRVATSPLGPQDLILGFLLSGFIIFLIAVSSLAPAETAEAANAKPALPGPAHLVMGALIFLVPTAAAFAFLRARGVSLREFLGLRCWPAWKVVGTGGLLVCAVMPLIMAIGSLMQIGLQGEAKEQDVVSAFREMAQAGNLPHTIMLVAFAVIIMPVVEELLFRGFLYPVFKGWAGALASTVFVSALFATLHLNLASLPALFVLALTFSLAYEWSGSIALPIVMHMTFNGIQLLLMTWQLQAR